MLKKRYIYSLITCKSACAVHGICIVLVNWKLAKNRYCGSIFLCNYNQKNYHLYSCARVGMSTRVKKTAYMSTGI